MIASNPDSGPTYGEAAAPSPRIVQVEYYTDPLCCWCWALEPHLRRIRKENEGQLVWRNRMGGMISVWSRYSDPLNDISRPMQMAPYWIQVKALTGAELDESIWMDDPPESSWPACLAVKAAEAQSPELGEALRYALCEAFMVRRLNVARPEIILRVAQELHKGGVELDVERLADEQDGPVARAAFAEDMRQSRYLGIGRFPALTLRRDGAPGLIAIGYRPYAALRDLFARATEGPHSAGAVSDEPRMWR